MFSFGRHKISGNLVIDIYKSSISLSFFILNNSTQIKQRKYSEYKSLDFLRVQSPKKELAVHSLETALEYVYAKLERQITKNKHTLNIENVIVVPHGSLSRLENYNLNVKLKHKQKIQKSLISEVIKHSPDSERVFKNLLNNSSDKRYFKSRKIITAILPNYYALKNWELKEVEYLGLKISHTLLSGDLHTHYTDMLKGIIPDAKNVVYINPGAILASALYKKQVVEGNDSPYNYIDVGAEYMVIYKIYDGTVVHSHYLDIGVNNLIRKLDKLSGVFELSESLLRNYLSGKCKGQQCELINAEIIKFKEEVSELIKKTFTAEKEQNLVSTSIFGRTKYVFNPIIDNELRKFIKNTINEALEFTRVYNKDFVTDDNKDYLELLEFVFDRRIDQDLTFSNFIML